MRLASTLLTSVILEVESISSMKEEQRMALSMDEIFSLIYRHSLIWLVVTPALYCDLCLRRTCSQHVLKLCCWICSQCKFLCKAINTKRLIISRTSLGLLLFSQRAHHGNTNFVSELNSINTKTLNHWGGGFIMSWLFCDAIPHFYLHSQKSEMKRLSHFTALLWLSCACMNFMFWHSKLKDTAKISNGYNDTMQHHIIHIWHSDLGWFVNTNIGWIQPIICLWIQSCLSIKLQYKRSVTSGFVLSKTFIFATITLSSKLIPRYILILN